MSEIAFSQPKTCFVCGTTNPHGLHVAFRQCPDGAQAEFTPTEHHEGWPGVVHGGILTCLLDEAMAYALWFADYRALTVRVATRFRATVSSGDCLVIAARVASQRRSLIEATGEVCLLDGKRIAEATGTFMLADVDYPVP